MAHYAFLDEDNIVTEVIVGIDENELIEGLDPEIWYGEFRGQTCKRTSYNAATNGFRYNYAGIGYAYDSTDDAFIAPQPYPSWILNDQKQWEAPIASPSDENFYAWNEDERTWDVVPK
jgi:hypothetical protein